MHKINSIFWIILCFWDKNVLFTFLLPIRNKIPNVNFNNANQLSQHSFTSSVSFNSQCCILTKLLNSKRVTVFMWFSICWNYKTTDDWNLTISHFALLRNNDASDKNINNDKVVQNCTLNTLAEKKIRKKQEIKITHANLQKLNNSLWPWT